MSNPTVAPVVLCVSHVNRPRVARAAIMALSTIGMLMTRNVAAQDSAPSTRTWELRATSGAFITTGSQRNSLKNAQVTAAQLSWVLRPSLAITGTFAWAASRDLGSIATEKLDVFTSDLGVEARSPNWFAGHSVSFSPFAGVGAGARSYNYRKLNVDAANNVAGYATVGGELGFKRVGVRIEARDYATGFKPLNGAGKSDTRNDVVLMVALRFNRHDAQQH
ncbi:MAG: hypothetical protein ABJB66_01075 [Gemmatimonadaceae bacterium]